MASAAGKVVTRSWRSRLSSLRSSLAARDAGILGLVFLLGGAPLLGDHVRIHRDEDVSLVDQSLDEHAVTALDDDSDLARVGLKRRDPGHQRFDRFGTVLDSGDLCDALLWCSERHKVELLGPIDANSQHIASLTVAKLRGRRHGAVLMDQSSWDNTLADVWPPRPFPQRRRLV